MTEQGPLPLVLGATGHRDIPGDAASVARLEQAVDGILARLQSAHPATPLVVLSALADGADQLVARVALRRGARLLVPLPMPREIYEATIADREQFARLASQGEVFTLPLADGVTTQGLASDDSARTRQYGVLASFLARQCHGLIALWDGTGTANPLEGGTAQVVVFHRSGVPVPLMPPSYPPDPVDRGTTWHVVAPRAGRDLPDGAFEVREILPDGHESEASARRVQRGIRERIDTFNGDAIALGSGAQPNDVAPGLPQRVHDIARRHAVADALASRWQQRAHAGLETLPWMGAAAVLCLQAYADWLGSRWLLSAYVIALGIAWTWFWWAIARPRTQDRFQDYRALAEGLRVELFWQAAGVRTCAADNYLGRQRSELAWIRQALRAWALTTPASRDALLGLEAEPRREDLDAARTRWIAEQCAYYARAAARDRDRLHRWERLRLAAFVLSMTVAAGAALAVQAAPDGSALRLALDPASAEGAHVSEAWHAGLVTLIALPAIVAGFVEYYIGRRAFAEHARQYARMAEDFTLLGRQLDALLQAGRLDEAREHLVRVGIMALAEHGDWVMLHRERPIDVPQGA